MSTLNLAPSVASTHTVVPMVRISRADCLTRLRRVESESIHAIVTDPPYEIGVDGGRGWDSTGIAYSVELWRECLRVLKPGGHMVVFGASRTTHRVICAIEDAGFDIRDVLAWHYAQGMPKGLDVSKDLDRLAGAKRKVVARKHVARGRAGFNAHESYRDQTVVVEVTEPATAEAKAWEGWNTALKPATEPIVLARKPMTTSTARTVLESGTGALNINATRVEGGRWPANALFDEHTASALGQAARYFFVPKPSPRERSAGLAGGNCHPTVKPIELMRYLVRLVTPPGGIVLDPFTGSGTTGCAAVLEGMSFEGIERDRDYCNIARKRIAYYRTQSPDALAA